MIKSFYYNKRAIFILFLTNCLFLIILFTFLALNIIYKAIWILFFLISIIVLIAFIQIIIFCVSYGKVIFTKNGIELYGKFMKTIKWNDVKGLYYCDFFIIADSNCLEIWFYDDNKVVQLFEKKDVKIFCTKKKYRNIVKLFPVELINDNPFIFYSNVNLKNKDKFRIYKD